MTHHAMKPFALALLAGGLAGGASLPHWSGMTMPDMMALRLASEKSVKKESPLRMESDVLPERLLTDGRPGGVTE